MITKVGAEGHPTQPGSHQKDESEAGDLCYNAAHLSLNRHSINLRVEQGKLRSPVAQLVERPAVGMRELQLPQETVVVKSGEFREACPELYRIRNGNPERSLPKGHA